MLTRAEPGSGERGSANNRGTTAASPVSRKASGQRHSRMKAPGAASANQVASGTARHCASGESAAHTRPGQHPRYTTSARPKNNAPPSGTTSVVTAPASTSGTSTKDTRGMAARFPQIPARETLSSSANPSGASASVMASCRRNAAPSRAPGSRPAGSRGVAVHSRMIPTAAKDSQKPADNGALGSSTSTAASASDQARVAPACRAITRTRPKAHNMIQVRCVGTESPASNA